jgi:hypothetical protein
MDFEAAAPVAAQFFGNPTIAHEKVNPLEGGGTKP